MPRNKEDTIKTTLALDGEKEYKAACAQINATLRELGSEMKLVSAEYADNADSTAALSAKQRILNDQLEEHRKRVAAAEKALSEMEEAGEGNEKAAQKMRIELNRAKTAFVNAERASKDLAEELNASESEYEQYKKAAGAIDETLEELGSELKLLDKQIGANADNADAMRKKHETLERVLSEQERKVRELEKAYAAAANDGDRLGKEASSLRTALNNAKSSIIDTEGEIKDLERAMDNAADGVDDAEAEFGDLGDALSNLGGPFGDAAGMLSDFSDKLGGFGVNTGALLNPATIAIAGTAAAIGSLVVEGTKFAAETTSAFISFTNQTGLAAEKSGEFRDVLLDIYDDGLGESLDDVASAMSAVVQATGETDPQKIKDLTSAALTLSSTFDMDVAESIRSAQQLMNTFGVTGESAYNTMAAAAQLGLNKDGNLLDVINEYATHYHQLGLDMDDLFSSMLNAKESGVFDLTYAGEAIKEFGIRVREGSDETKDALKSLGLNADDAVEAFNKGGPEAKESMLQVVAALNDVEDATKRNQIGVALFGTAWEDLGVRGVQAATDFNSELENVDGTIDEINEADLSTIEGSWERLGRVVNTNFMEPVGTFFETTLPPLINGAVALIESGFIGFGSKANLYEKIGENAAQEIEDGFVIQCQRFYDTTQEELKTIIVDGVEMVEAQGPTLGEELVLVPLEAFEQTAPQLEGTVLNELKTLDAQALGQVNAEAPEIGTAWTSGVTGMITSGMSDVSGAAKDVMFQAAMMAKELAQSEGQLTGADYDNNLIAGIGTNSEQVTGKMRGLVGDMVDAARSYREDFEGAGVYTAEGYWAGLNSQKDTLIGKVRGFMGSVVSVVRSALQINSPSKVFEEIGVYSAQGYEQGFVNEMRSVEDEIAGAMQTMTGDAEAAGTADGRAAQYFHVEQHIHAEQTDYAEQQRRAAREFRLLARGI